MIGISIFLITLIIAATMISGLLVGLQSRTIDYDAVAYRTGVILVEDPGEPNAMFNYKTLGPDDQWELIDFDRRELISRFGLTLYKSTPRVLSQEKVDNFFSGQYSNPEIQERIIFGSYPYRFNVAYKEIGGASSPSVGDPYGADSAYGYIRRVVLIKKPIPADIGMSTNYGPAVDGKFRVELDYTKLMNLDKDPDYLAPQFWIEPPKEKIPINLKNVDTIKSTSNLPRLNSIRIEFEGQNPDGTVATGELPVAVVATIDETTKHTFDWPVSNPVDVGSSVNIIFDKEYSIPTYSYAGIAVTKMYVVYEFDPSSVIISNTNIYRYPEGIIGYQMPTLQPAVLEVRVW